MNVNAIFNGAQRLGRKRNIVTLSGLLALILIANGVISLFSLHLSNQKHLANLQTFSDIASAMESARAAQLHFKKQVQEWKNILLRGSNAADFARHRAAFDQEEHLMDQELVTLAALARKLNLSLPEVEQLPRTHSTLGEQYRKALLQFRPDQASTASAVDQRVRGIDRAPTDQMDAIVKNIESSANALLKQAGLETVENYHRLRVISVAATSIGILVVLVLLGLSFAELPKD